MPRRRKAKKTSKRGAGWGKKILLGVAGLGTAALAIQGYRVKQSGLGSFMARAADNRPNYAVPGYKWGG